MLIFGGGGGLFQVVGSLLWVNGIRCSIITQYGSTCAYRDCYGLSPLKTIYKDFVHFQYQFKVDSTFNDIKVKNV